LRERDHLKWYRMKHNTQWKLKKKNRKIHLLLMIILRCRKCDSKKNAWKWWRVTMMIGWVETKKKLHKDRASSINDRLTPISNIFSCHQLENLLHFISQLIHSKRYLEMMRWINSMKGNKRDKQRIKLSWDSFRREQQIT
jgi:hypothetical protein